MFAQIQIQRDVYGSEDHALIKQTARDFFEQEIIPNHEKWEEDGMISREAWLKAGELGLLCTNMPMEYGGAGLDFTFSALLGEELGRTGCTGPGFMLHSDIVAPYILHHGNEAQKQRWLPRMATGELIGSIAMTEPGAGSDLKNIRTIAVDKGDYYLLNGSKTFITNGYMCDLALVATKIGEGISLLIVEGGSPGYTKGKPFKKIGMKAQDTCELFFEDVKIPKENLIGEEGKGFDYMVEELARERLLVAIGAMGVAEEALERTIEYVQSREAFNKMIAGFQNTQFKLAELATQIQIHQVFVDKCVQLVCENKLTAEQASMAKYSCTDMQCAVMDECLQFHGGYGYMWEYFIARAYADARVQRIYAGTNEIMKLIISRGLLKDYFSGLKAEKDKKLVVEEV